MSTHPQSAKPNSDDPIVVRARELARADGNEWCIYHAIGEEREEDGDELFDQYLERARGELDGREQGADEFGAEPRRMILGVETAGGALEIAHAPRPAPPCSACASDATLTIDVEVTGGNSARIPICGTCLAKAVAIHLGARHVQAGGRLTDLEWKPTRPPPTTAQE